MAITLEDLLIELVHKARANPDIEAKDIIDLDEMHTRVYRAAVAEYIRTNNHSYDVI